MQQLLKKNKKKIDYLLNREQNINNFIISNNMNKYLNTLNIFIKKNNINIVENTKIKDYVIYEDLFNFFEEKYKKKKDIIMVDVIEFLKISFNFTYEELQLFNKIYKLKKKENSITQINILDIVDELNYTNTLLLNEDKKNDIEENNSKKMEIEEKKMKKNNSKKMEIEEKKIEENNCKKMEIEGKKIDISKYDKNNFDKYSFSSNGSKKIKEKKDIIYNINNENYIYKDCADTDREYNLESLNIEIPENYKKKYENYNYLKKFNDIEQRSVEWFTMRENMITASSISSVVDKNPKYGSQDTVLYEKLGFKNFEENECVYHGKKYEKIALMIYENLYNTKVGEFGLVQHKKYSFLGASPDGITMNITLDKKFNKDIGKLIEIKCPLRRQIKNMGLIEGVICPHYYWVQIQVQLECCDFDECDFWQCDIQEYNSFEEIEKFNYGIITDNIIYNGNSCESYRMPEYNKYINRGCIIQLKPKKLNNAILEKINTGKHKIEWYCKYIYPDTLLKSQEEYNIWCTYVEKNYETLYPNLVDEWKYDKVKYWVLNKAHNVLIKKDKKWFEENLPTIETFWNKVIEYRNNSKLKYDFIIKMQKKK